MDKVLPLVDGTRRAIHDGIQITHYYPNDYGYSVVRHSMSHGYSSNLFELAVLHRKNFMDDGFTLCYNTPITHDVIGYLDETDIVDIAKKIADLPVNTFCSHYHKDNDND